MKTVIEATDISKSYKISHLNKPSYGTLKDDFTKLLKRPFGGNSDKLETFWALKDINFQVAEGEAFGIIGKNGSGKSTLLKILSRIIDPDSGRVKIHGQVASMLEVGTGFHPELTGRENIYFNGSIIGMSRREITRKFDEIVAFSDVEQFLDTPVKFYSSGMYVRLAFAVAAHLDSEILIIDEVLAVGDAEFQKRCMDRMQKIAKEGRTILFVSHSMSSVKQLCDKAMLLDKGKIKSVGEIDKVLLDYTESMPDQQDPLSTVLHEIVVYYSKVKELEKLAADSTFEAEVEFAVKESLPNLSMDFFVDNSAGSYVLHSINVMSKNNSPVEKGNYKVTIQLPRLSLNTGSYSTWFRFTCSKEHGEYALDTERQVFSVKDNSEDKYSAINLPASWRMEVVNKK